MAYRLRILHLSDTQFRASENPEAWRRVPMLGEAWERNLEVLQAEGAVDLVAFTGDATATGRPEEFAVATSFLGATLRKLGLPRERLFVVPGNHDIDRQVATEAWKRLREAASPQKAEAFARWAAGREPLPGLEPTLRDQVLGRQQAYRQWVREGLGRPSLVSQPHALGYRETLRLPGWPFELHVIGLDSAWLSGDDRDMGRLWLTEEQVRRVVTHKGNQSLSGFRLALMHHPMRYLAEQERGQRLLGEYLDLLLRGHLHELEPGTFAAPESRLRVLAAGYLTERSRTDRRCQLVELVLDETGRPMVYTAWVRSWSNQNDWQDGDSFYSGSHQGRRVWMQKPETTARQPAADEPLKKTLYARARTLSQASDDLVNRGELDEALRLLREHVLPTYESLGDDKGRAFTCRRMARILLNRSELDAALQLLRAEVLPVFERLDDAQQRAITLWHITDVLQERNELDEALQILREEVLPALKRLGDIREQAVTLHKIADILEGRRELDEALRILREEVLPVFERLGDIRESAVALNSVARILHIRGDRDEALQILRERSLPVFERLGAVRERALVLQQIADILQARGELGEALRLLREEVLPTFERLGAALERTSALMQTVNVLQIDGRWEEARQLLRSEALPALEKLADQKLVDPGRRKELLKGISKSKRSKRPPSFTLQSLEIRNLKNIAHLKIDFTKHSSLAGQWRCIAGINGAGKSTVLQAVACVLLGQRLVQDLGVGRLGRMLRRQPSEDSQTEIHAQVSNGHESFELYIPLGPEGLDLERLEAHSRYKEMREFWDWRMHCHLLVSYGAGRNLSEDVKVDIGKDRSAEVRRQFTLFEPLAQVAHADVLLREDRMPAAALRHLHGLLTELLKDSSLELVPESKPLMFNVGGATVSTAELPDGFRALVTWVADLCASWYDKAPEDAEQDDLSLLEGIVLLDEIDLHLHPSLQRTLVPRLRRLLPGVQWIVTTHSPLVLVSFDSNELVPLEGFSGGVRQLDRQILSFSTDEVYRWLMRTEPTSAALEELWNAPEQNGSPRLGALMAQSPELSEEDIRLNEQWLKQRQIDLEKGGSGA